jgi:antitoxin HigA-1
MKRIAKLTIIRLIDIMNMMRKPAHPGRVLRNLYIKPLNLTITKVSAALGVSRKAVSAIVNEHKSVTPEMALRLSKAFDTTPDLWLNLQKKHDLWFAATATDDWTNVQSLYRAPNATQ